MKKEEENNENSISVNGSGVKLIFCQPFNAEYFIYSINSYKKQHLATRPELVEIINEYTPSIVREVEEYISHLRTFIIFVETSEIEELTMSIEDKQKEIDDRRANFSNSEREEKSDLFQDLNLKDKLSSLFSTKAQQQYD